MFIPNNRIRLASHGLVTEKVLKTDTFLDERQKSHTRVVVETSTLEDKSSSLPSSKDTELSRALKLGVNLKDMSHSYIMDDRHLLDESEENKILNQLDAAKASENEPQN